MQRNRFEYLLLTFSLTCSAFSTFAAGNGKMPIGPTTPIGHSLKFASTISLQSTPNALPTAPRDYKWSLNSTHQSTRENLRTTQNIYQPIQDKSKVFPSGNGSDGYGFDLPKSLTGVPKAFVNLGSSITYGIIVEKLHHRLSLLRTKENRTYEIVKTYRAITGKDPGDKKERGDLRTPEGIYFVTGRKPDAELPAKYGRLALTLDYPNIYDQRSRKSGDGIWIHATDDPARLLRPFDTEGCVVLNNEDVADLAQYIEPFETPVVITKEMTTTEASELMMPRTKAFEMILAWRKAWETSNFDEYMSFYSKEFVSLGKNRQQWETFKQNLSKLRKADIQVKIGEPKIIAFEDQLLAVFPQTYRSKDHSDTGKKFLYLKWEENRYRIIAEKWYKGRPKDTAFREFRAL